MGPNSPLGSEGIPHELEIFTQIGMLGDQEATMLDTGQAWQPKDPEKAVVHRGEFPIDKAVVHLR